MTVDFRIRRPRVEWQWSRGPWLLWPRVALYRQSRRAVAPHASAFAQRVRYWWLQLYVAVGTRRLRVWWFRQIEPQPEDVIS